MVINKIKYMCQKCEYISTRYLGRCPNCDSWNSFIEIEDEKKISNKNLNEIILQKNNSPQLLNDVKINEISRLKTKYEEFNRVLGGGIVPGSLILIGGAPGIGKSTLLLQIASQLALNEPVLYVSGEESSVQIKIRANRLNINGNFYIYSETDTDKIYKAICEIQPQYLIVDSIQTMKKKSMNSMIGSISQIKEITTDLMSIAKLNNMTIFIVGHVTKDGFLAGPKVLEHMVDTVLYFEGDKHQTYRILRSVKNRFGSTNEIGLFDMNLYGLSELSNPSKMFLEERLNDTIGSSVVVSLEGSRPILVEIQALLAPTSFGNARRTTTGLDHNRVSLIIAVLEKKIGLKLHNQDAYLKAVGGVKLDEPAIDLSIAISIVSSYQNLGTNLKDCFIGELGLTGEIRSVNYVDKRILEAQKLGFTRVFIPKHNLKKLKIPNGIQVIGVKTLLEALKYVFNYGRK